MTFGLTLREWLAAAGATMLIAASRLMADEAAIDVTSGEMLIPPSAMESFALVRRAGDPVGVVTQAVLEGVTTTVFRVTVTNPHAFEWDVCVREPVAAECRRDDVLWVDFMVRMIPAGTNEEAGVVTVLFERAGEPYDKALYHSVDVGADWLRISKAFVLEEDAAPETWQAGLNFGDRAQTVEIAAFSLRRFPAGTPVGALPSHHSTYAGRGPDALWRKAAEERIDQYRKADARIKVVDAGGEPLAGALVKLAMRRHRFAFGTAVGLPQFSGDARMRSSEEKASFLSYRRQLVRCFNSAVLENGLKWPQTERLGYERAVEAVRELRDVGFDVRGHVLVWPSWKNSPSRLQKLKDDPVALNGAVLDRIDQATSMLRGLLLEWDVVNEPYTNHDLLDILGENVMVEWFRRARKGAPEARLFLNDYDILSEPFMGSAHHRYYQSVVTNLLAAGAPIGGLGMQSHFANRVTPPEKVLKILDHYAQFGLPIRVTEFDHDTDDEALQADYLRDFLTAVFSHPAVDGFFMWGFWDGLHWKDNAPLFREDWSLKPSGEVYLSLVKDRWWSRMRGTTESDGSVGFRAFLGSYDVYVTDGTRTGWYRLEIPPGGVDITLTVK